MITMKKIAQEAGVSQPTVSVVLNGRSGTVRISEKTKEKILVAAHKLGYRKNEVARSMKTGKTNIIGIVGGLHHSYSLEMIKGISEAAAEGRYTTKLITTASLKDIETAARICVEQRLDGVICRSVSSEGFGILVNELNKYEIPCVVLGNLDYHPGVLHVFTDDFAGTYELTEYLISLGHRAIGFVDGKNVSGNRGARFNGYRKCLEDNNLFDKEQLCWLFEGDNPPDYTDSISKYINESKISALICGNDMIAMWVIQVAAKLGVSIPGNLSLAGYGDLEYAQLATPRLTTVRQPFYVMGKKAAETLISKINHVVGDDQFKLPVELIVRESTAKLNR